MDNARGPLLKERKQILTCYCFLICILCTEPLSDIIIILNAIGGNLLEDIQNSCFNQGILRDLNKTPPNFLLQGPDVEVIGFALLNPELFQSS